MFVLIDSIKFKKITILLLSLFMLLNDIVLGDFN